MARYIDADAMLETLKRKYPQWYTGKPKDSWMHYAWLVYHQAVENAPTVDAVPVVRCKNCKMSEVFQNDSSGVMARYCKAFTLKRMVADDDYCSYGERKDNE